MKIGFTGTRDDLTINQITALLFLLRELKDSLVDEFHHGDCIGADRAAHCLAELWTYYTIAHPPEDSKYRAWCKSKVILEPRPYLERNKDIVNAVTLLIACPKETTEQQRSGTWSTVRYARKCGIERRIIFPDGATNIEHTKRKKS